MPKEKVYVPVVEPKSTSYLEYKELGRTVTPCSVFKKDTVRVRVLQICRGNPAETFETEKHWEYDIPWSEKKEEVMVVISEPERARNSKGHFVKDDASTPNVNEAYVDGKTPKRKPRKAAAKKKPVAKKAPAKKAPAKAKAKRKTTAKK